MVVRCPICKKEVQPGVEDFPFCSERCRLIDLGNWASEQYKISEPAKTGGQVEDAEDDE